MADKSQTMQVKAEVFAVIRELLLQANASQEIMQNIDLLERRFDLDYRYMSGVIGVLATDGLSDEQRIEEIRRLLE